MGTKEELPQEPVEKTVFMEDMSDHELATVVNFLNYLPLLESKLCVQKLL